jgi:hypothetical protein
MNNVASLRRRFGNFCGVFAAGFWPKIPNFAIQAFFGPQERLKTETLV